jgi:hypothetical protein
MVWGSNPSGDEIFCTYPGCPWIGTTDLSVCTAIHRCVKPAATTHKIISAEGLLFLSMYIVFMRQTRTVYMLV